MTSAAAGRAGQGPGGAPALLRRTLVLAAPFLSGAVIMALELLGLRLLQPHFGASTHVWGALLGMVMVALAVGYLVGGSMADRRPRPAWIFVFLLAAGVYLIGVLRGGRGLLTAGEALGDVGGPLVATLLLLGPPMVLLGAVSPFVIRLLAEFRWLGTTAGRVFALSTAGSILGTFLTAFWLIPNLGTRTTLRAWTAALLLVAVAGLVARRPWAIALLLLPGADLLLPEPDHEPSLIYRGESAYHTVLVGETGRGRALYLNESRAGFHSVQLPEQGLTGLYYDALLLAPALAGGRDILVLGMAAGTTVQGYRRLYGGAHVTAVEIDPLVVRVARDFFGVQEGPGLRIHIGDARRFLGTVATRYDVVEVDLFAGGPEAPFHGLTREFFRLVRDHLRPDGVVVVNALALGGDPRVSTVVAATLASEFPSVLEVALEHNRVLFAFPAPVGPETARARAARAREGSPAQELAPLARVLAPSRFAAATPVLTDDHAPVERLTRAMVRRWRAAASPARPVQELPPANRRRVE